MISDCVASRLLSSYPKLTVLLTFADSSEFRRGGKNGLPLRTLSLVKFTEIRGSPYERIRKPISSETRDEIIFGASEFAEGDRTF